MRVVRDVSALRDLVGQARSTGKTVSLVPTMGALHEGHLSLVRVARDETGFVVVSIFVNPLQFAPGEDFTRYPRREAEDLAALEHEAADVVYLPEAADLYPSDFSTTVDVAGVSEGGEGAMRPGHFRGVATVVAKLFLHAAPDVTVFGRKDLQQVAVVRRMIRDLGFPIRLVVGDTVREPDGLAMSSRNAYLSPEERRLAAAFPRALFDARNWVAAGRRDAGEIVARVRQELERTGLTVDYVDVVDPDTMAPLAQASPGAALAAAVRVGSRRLIDNVRLS